MLVMDKQLLTKIAAACAVYTLMEEFRPYDNASTLCKHAKSSKRKRKDSDSDDDSADEDEEKSFSLLDLVKSLRNQLYEYSRELGDIQSVAGGPASLVRRKIRKTFGPHLAQKLWGFV
jgi:hypothetical protein